MQNGIKEIAAFLKLSPEAVEELRSGGRLVIGVFGLDQDEYLDLQAATMNVVSLGVKKYDDILNVDSKLCPLTVNQV